MAAEIGGLGFGEICVVWYWCALMGSGLRSLALLLLLGKGAGGRAGRCMCWVGICWGGPEGFPGVAEGWGFVGVGANGILGLRWVLERFGEVVWGVGDVQGVVGCWCGSAAVFGEGSRRFVYCYSWYQK